MENKNSSVFSKAIKAGKKRTYFFDIRTTKSNDYFLTITESRRKLSGDGYDKNKLFLYKEDFNKFLAAMQETIDHVKTELLPDYDFASFDRENEDEGGRGGYDSYDNKDRGERKNNYNQQSENKSSENVRGDDASEKLNPKKSSDDDFGHTSSLFNEDGEKW